MPILLSVAYWNAHSLSLLSPLHKSVYYTSNQSCFLARWCFKQTLLYLSLSLFLSLKILVKIKISIKISKILEKSKEFYIYKDILWSSWISLLKFMFWNTMQLLHILIKTGAKSFEGGVGRGLNFNLKGTPGLKLGRIRYSMINTGCVHCVSGQMV